MEIPSSAIRAQMVQIQPPLTLHVAVLYIRRRVEMEVMVRPHQAHLRSAGPVGLHRPTQEAVVAVAVVQVSS